MIRGVPSFHELTRGTNEHGEKQGDSMGKSENTQQYKKQMKASKNTKCK
jgi:hypothetical protein